MVSPIFRVKRLLVAYLALVWSAMGLGAIVGILVNGINGHVCHVYFFDFFYRNTVSNINSDLDLLIVQWGMKWGATLGLGIGLFFAASVFWVSVARCSYWQAVTYFRKMLVVVGIGWIVGGVNGVLVSMILPIYALSVSSSSSPPSLWFWVIGSQWGACLGSIVALMVGCSWFARDWKRGQEKEWANSEYSPTYTE